MNLILILVIWSIFSVPFGILLARLIAVSKCTLPDREQCPCDKVAILSTDEMNRNNEISTHAVSSSYTPTAVLHPDHSKALPCPSSPQTQIASTARRSASCSKRGRTMPARA